MKCSYCGVYLGESDYANKYCEMIFCDICWDAIARMTPAEEKIQEKFIDPEDGTVHYY